MVLAEFTFKLLCGMLILFNLAMKTSVCLLKLGESCISIFAF